jgi:hypothetical protein
MVRKSNKQRQPNRKTKKTAPKRGSSADGGLIWTKWDVLLVILFPLLASGLTVLFQLNFLMATLLFFGVPCLYLSARRPALIKKTLIFSLIFFAPMVFIIDYPAYLDAAWYVPNSLFRFLQNGIPIEDVIWAFLWVYFAVIFWEYFLDAGKIRDHFSKHMRYLLILLSVLLVAFFFAYFVTPKVLYEPYFYLKMGIIFVVFPLCAILIRFPQLIRKVLIIGAYFFMVSFLAEYVGLRGYHWYFPGEHFLGTLTLAGQKLPYDEIIFWWALGVPGIICWYEFFADDRK